MATTPVMRSVVLGGIVFAMSALYMSAEPCEVQRRLVLHTTSQPSAIYMTAWSKGDVVVSMKRGDLRPITFEVRGTAFDCKTLGTETLTPLDETTYFYEYSETILSCEPGAGVVKTPRTGLVTVEPY